jgi:DNA polymerase III subunit delta'
MIEEPPARALFLILAHRPGLILPTIRSRCRRLQLDPLAPSEILSIVQRLGEPWSDIDANALEVAAGEANGSVRETLKRIDPARSEMEAMIASVVAKLPELDSRAVHKLAEAVSARGADDAFEDLTLALYDWLEAQARTQAGQGAARLAPLADLWEKARAATRDTETYNLDKRLHVLSLFAEVSAAARRL